jgi:hypothetical protein
MNVYNVDFIGLFLMGVKDPNLGSAEDESANGIFGLRRK